MTKAPFTQDQINHIDDYQHAGIVHEMTCANDGSTLEAYHDGLHCAECNYIQDWVPDGVADGEFLKTQQALFAALGGHI